MKKLTTLILLATLAVSLIFIPAIQAQAPAGVGVLGDSQSQPYRCINRGNSTSFNWVEYAYNLRGINFGGGVCPPYVKAISGNTVEFGMKNQTDKVLTNINAGQVGKVVIMLGHNDVHNPNPAPNIVTTILGIYRTQLDRILAAGIAPSNVLMSGVLPSSYYKTSANIAAFNQGLADLAAEKGTVFVPWTLSPTQTYIVGGETISPCSSNEYHCLRLADGHTGSVGNGLILNTFAFFFGVAPLSDAEILSLPQGVAVPTSTPAVTVTPSRTPTVTRTPTASATPTATPLWMVIDCSPLNLIFEQLTPSSGRWRCG